KALSGADMTLKYGGDGQTLEHAVISGDAAIELAGESASGGRQIVAKTLDITLAADGSTPMALGGREAVQLTFPAEQGMGARTIRAQTMDARGEPGRGLTSARFVGDVDYREDSARGEPVEPRAGPSTS